MEVNGKDVYFVAVKAFLRDGDKLLITHDVFGSWDLPGGRIKKHEFESPLEDVLERKIKEELGNEVAYSVGKPIEFFRVERMEEVSGQEDMPVRIFAVGYEVSYEGGDITLGENHNKFEWVDVKSFDPVDKFTGGWLKGLQEYLRSEDNS